MKKASHPARRIRLVVQDGEGALHDLGPVRLDPLVLPKAPRAGEFYEAGDPASAPFLQVAGPNGKVVAQLNPADLSEGRLPDVIRATIGERTVTLHFGGAAEELLRSRCA